MANIMSQMKLRNHTSRNGFDLSFKNAFTAKVGELLPVACFECIPGDDLKARIQHFTRTQPVNTAAYTRIREYYDWFFVPTNLLWNKFNTFITQMNDNNQHATSITGNETISENHPHLSPQIIKQYLDTLKEQGENNRNIFNYERHQLTGKLLNYLGYGRYVDADGNTLPYRTNLMLNPFPLLAYQKIYQDYYRNSQWEKSYAPAFNVDYMTNSQDMFIPVADLINNPTLLDRSIENMFDLRYRNWNKDLFMGVMPSQQYGDAASVNLGDGTGTIDLTLGNTSDISIPLRLRNFDGTTPDPNIGLVTSSNVISDGVSRTATVSTKSQNMFLSAAGMANIRNALGLTSSSISGSAAITQTFSILALRQAEALQRWKEITQSQQKDYVNQIEAHFGVSPSNALSERCQFIEGQVSNLDISEVTNTNLTGDSDANIAGKGVGVGSSKTSYKTKVHGYLMCIYSAMPLLDYAITGVAKQNTHVRATDYAIPEFDRIGMQYLGMYHLTNTPLTFTPPDEILGYVPRYYEYKTKIDEVHGAFVDGGLESWVAPVDDSYILSYLSAQHGQGNDKPLNYTFFKVNPAFLNPIFGVNADSSYKTDQLLINCSFDVSAVRNLDRNGLPM